MTINQARDVTTKAVTCNHSASRKSVEQACDTRPTFRWIVTISKSITNENLPTFGLKQKIVENFVTIKTQRKLNLKATKECVPSDFLSCYPGLMSKVASNKAVVCKFVDNGMLDTSSYSLPDYTSIICTCKTPLHIDMDLIVELRFDELFDEQARFDILSNAFMHRISIKRNKKYAGDKVGKTSPVDS